MLDRTSSLSTAHGPTAPAGAASSSACKPTATTSPHPQFPLTALADDVARLRQVLDLQDGPAIVAGHSYGGQVMTALGPDAPNVAGLVYIAAFGLDQGESLGALLSQGPVTPALAHLFTDSQGFGWLSEDDFVSHFAADVDPVKAKVMYAVQQPLATSAFGDVMGVPAWKTLPSWYLVAADDQAHPARCRAAVRQPHGRHHRRDPLQPRRDGLPSRRRGPAHQDGGRSRAGYQLDRRIRSQHDKRADLETQATNGHLSSHRQGAT